MKVDWKSGIVWVECLVFTCRSSYFNKTYTSRSIVFSPRDTAFQSLETGRMRLLACKTNELRKLQVPFVHQVQKCQQIETMEQSPYGVVAKQTNKLPVFPLFSSKQNWPKAFISEWISMHFNQETRLPKATDRELPSSPSCQLQGMLCVNLIRVQSRGSLISLCTSCRAHHFASWMVGPKHTKVGQWQFELVLFTELFLLLARDRGYLASVRRESSNRTDQPWHNEITPRAISWKFPPCTNTHK